MPEITIETPTGPFHIAERDGVIVKCGWGAGSTDETPVLRRAARQIRDYFEGALIEFDLPLVLKGSEAELKLRAALCAIPFGETRTYGELAKDLNMSPQAVGQLCGANPIPLIVPCHRVLGTGNLGGFSAPGGIETKIFLLKLEGAGGLLI